MVEEGGNVIARVLPNRQSAVVLPTLAANIKPASRITSDAEHSFGALGYMGRGYQHTILNHRAGERSRGSANNNTVEGFWNLVKRGINGTYISVSAKLLPTYLGEFKFRYNLRKAPHLVLPLLMKSFARGLEAANRVCLYRHRRPRHASTHYGTKEYGDHKHCAHFVGSLRELPKRVH
jgi:hypothetical protein